MFDDLSFGEAQQVAPRKMERRTAELPGPIARAYDATLMGQATVFPVSLPAGADAKMIGARLCGLLKKYAKGTGTVAFKASYEIKDGGLLLYWQKKLARISMPMTLSGESALAHLVGEGEESPIQVKPRNRSREGGGAR